MAVTWKKILMEGYRITTTELPAMTDEKIWKGTGANVEEITVPPRTTTKVIALSDATADEKATADFVCDNNDDYVQFQAANDAAAAVSHGRVHVSSGIATLEGALILTVPFDGEGAKLFGGVIGTRIVAAQHKITVRRGGNLTNMAVYGRNATPTPTILIETLDDVNIYNRMGWLKNLIVANISGDQVGIGVKFETISADGEERHIELCEIGPLTVVGFEYGLWLYSEEIGTSGANIAGNTFAAVFTENCKNNIRIESTGGSSHADGNHFLSVHLEGYADVLQGIELVGGSQVRFNTFHSVMAWDWNNCPTAPTFKISSGTTNTFAMLYGGSDVNVEDNANDSSNVVIVNNGVDVKLASTMADHGYSGTAKYGTAGENLVFRDIVYLKSDGKWWKTDADAEATSKGIIRMALATIAADADGLLLVKGLIRDDSDSWTQEGVELFLSPTAGNLTETRPSSSGQIVKVLGHAEEQGAAYMEFDPSKTYVEIA